MKIYNLPTGKLLVDNYTKGKLETLSIGDYGKEHNIKADFLGYDREINGVPNIPTKPLSEKWVITLSTQYGCSLSCNFCDCPKVPFKGDVSFTDLLIQFNNAIKLYPDVKYTDRLNVHFARMGEPMFNFNNVYKFSEWLYYNKSKITNELRVEVVHPVFTTTVPKFAKVWENLNKWCHLKNNIYNGQAGLQLSINSTNEKQRNNMFNGKVTELGSLSLMGKRLPNPIGRKYCLNFAYSNEFEIDANKLKELFNPDKFMVKITPIHNNNACKNNNIETLNGYVSYDSYREVENNLKGEGFDVLVFIPSFDEENSLITCGNAILSGSEIKIKGS